MADLKSGVHAPLQAHRPCCAAWPMPSPRIRGPLLSSQRQEPCGSRLEPRVVLVSSCRGERVRHGVGTARAAAAEKEGVRC